MAESSCTSLSWVELYQEQRYNGGRGLKEEVQVLSVCKNLEVKEGRVLNMHMSCFLAFQYSGKGGGALPVTVMCGVYFITFNRMENLIMPLKLRHSRKREQYHLNSCWQVYHLSC